MAAEAGGCRFGTSVTFRGRETWGEAGWGGVGGAIAVLVFTVLLAIIVLLNGERGGQQALEGLLVQHQSGPGRRHVFRRGGKFFADLIVVQVWIVETKKKGGEWPGGALGTASRAMGGRGIPETGVQCGKEFMNAS